MKIPHKSEAMKHLEYEGGQEGESLKGNIIRQIKIETLIKDMSKRSQGEIIGVQRALSNNNSELHFLIAKLRKWRKAKRASVCLWKEGTNPFGEGTGAKRVKRIAPGTTWFPRSKGM